MKLVLGCIHSWVVLISNISRDFHHVQDKSYSGLTLYLFAKLLGTLPVSSYQGALQRQIPVNLSKLLMHRPPWQSFPEQKSGVISQFTPLNPWTQWHLYPLTRSSQVPPYKHVSASHSTVNIQKIQCEYTSTFSF